MISPQKREEQHQFSVTPEQESLQRVTEMFWGGKTTPIFLTLRILIQTIAPNTGSRQVEHTPVQDTILKTSREAGKCSKKFPFIYIPNRI